MTKAELMKVLESYEDDEVVRFTLDCDNSYRNIDYIQKRGNAGIVLVSEEIPDADDIHSMVDEILDNKNHLTNREEEILREFASL